MKYTIKVFRTEVYETDIEIEASGVEEAIRIAEDKAYDQEDAFHWRFMDMEMECMEIGELEQMISDPPRKT
jgi:hypothetical protein